MNSGIQYLTLMIIQYKLIKRIDSRLKVNYMMPIANQQKNCGVGEDSLIYQLKRDIGKIQSVFEGYDNTIWDNQYHQMVYIKIQIELRKNHQCKQKNMMVDLIKSLQNKIGKYFFKRNQSIVVDLMYGQFRSRLDCPKCNQNSITFDSFLMCNLPIPQNNKQIFQLVLIKNHTKLISYLIPFENNTTYKVSRIIDAINTNLFIKNNIIVTDNFYYSSQQIETHKQANQVLKIIYIKLQQRGSLKS